MRDAFMELLLRQTQRLTQLQYQSIELLQMGSLELSEYLQELSQENPVMDLEASFSNQMPAHRDDVVQRLHGWRIMTDRTGIIRMQTQKLRILLHRLERWEACRKRWSIS